jgi:hypothetical protein
MMDTVLRIFSLISTVLIALAIWGLIRQVRKTQRLHLAAPIIGLIIAPIMLIINLIFLNRALPGWLAPALLIMGLGFGLAWGQTARLSRQHDAIVTRRSVLHLILWAIAYAVTQLLITFAPLTAVAGGLAAMFFSTGTTVGTNLNLLGRALRLRKQA